MFAYKDITDLLLSGFGLCGYIFKGADPFIALSLASEYCVNYSSFQMQSG